MTVWYLARYGFFFCIQIFIYFLLLQVNLKNSVICITHVIYKVRFIYKPYCTSSGVIWLQPGIRLISSFISVFDTYRLNVYEVYSFLLSSAFIFRGYFKQLNISFWEKVLGQLFVLFIRDPCKYLNFISFPSILNISLRVNNLISLLQSKI